MASFIRGGVPIDFNLDGETYSAAEGENALIKLSGRGGAVHIAGDSTIYREQNPQLGGVNQTLSCDEAQFALLREAQNSSEKLTGYMTMPSGETYNMVVAITNDGALELDNGTVSLELAGNITLQ